MNKKFAEYLLNKTKQDYNKASQIFSNCRQKIWQEFKFLFNNYLSSGDRVLDLGCGNGRFSEICQDRKADYFGVDISEKLIKIAKQKYYRAKFQTADALNLPFADNFFDKIFCIAVLHNIPSKNFRLQALKEAKRALKPNGLLILTCWNLWTCPKKRKEIFKSNVFKILGRNNMDFKDILLPFCGMESCYFHCFTKKELNKLVKKAGFSIEKSGEIVVSQEKRPNSNFYVIAKA